MDAVKLEIPKSVHFSDDELFALCASNKDLRIEKNKNGNLIIMSPVGGISSFYESELGGSLWSWNQIHGLGVVLSPSAGFVLKDGSVLSPDVAWIRKDRWTELTLQQKEKFIPICPDFVAQIRSKSDSLKSLKEKMMDWMSNGCRLAWLIDPLEQQVYIYNSANSLPVQVNFDSTLSDDVLPGFSFSLPSLK